MFETVASLARSMRSNRLAAVTLAASAIAFALGPDCSQAQQPRNGGRGPAYGGQRGGSQPAETNGESKKREPPAPPPKSTGIAAQAEHKKPTYEHNRFVLSPDAKRIAISGAHLAKDASGKLDKSPTGKPPEPFLEVIEVATGRSMAVFKDGATYDNLALSPNGDFLAAEDIARRGTFKVWHIPTKKSKELPMATRVLSGGVAFAHDNRSLILVSPTGMKTAPLAGGTTKEMKFESPAVSVSYCAANNLLAIGISRSRYGKIEIQVYDLAKQKEVKALAMQRLPSVVQFSGDGKFLGAALAGGALAVWQTSDWTQTGSTLNAFSFEAGQIAVAPDGQTVAVRPKVPRGATTELFDIQSGDKTTPLLARDIYYLPTGLLALSNAEGPHYFDPASATSLALPPAAAPDPSLVAGASESAPQQLDASTAQPLDAASPAATAPSYPGQPSYPTAPGYPGQPGNRARATPPAKEQPR